MINIEEVKQALIEEETAEDLEEDQHEDEVEGEMDLQRELDGFQEGATPMPEDQLNAIKFLKDILDGEDRFKTANLTWEELGKPTFSTRFWLNLASTCENLYGFIAVAEYCKKKARITTDTSLSREGFMAALAVTQKKVREKKGNAELTKFLTTRK